MQVIKKTIKIKVLTYSQKTLFVKMQAVLFENKKIFIILREVSQEERYKEELLKVKRRAQLLTAYFLDEAKAVAFLDLDFEFIFYNSAFSEAFALLFKTKLKKNAKLINALSDLPDKQLEVISACQQALAKNQPVHLKIRMPNFECYKLTLKPIFVENINALGIMLTMENFLTINKQEEMSAILAHEISQPLMAVNSYAEGCMARLGNSMQEITKVLNVMQHIVKQVDYVGEIVHGVKNLRHEEKAQSECCNINDLITHTISLLNYELDRFNIKLSLNLNKKLPSLLVNKGHIAQVVFNLVRNSIEAIQTNPNILNPVITIRSCKEKNFIAIHVLDNGPGFDNEFSFNKPNSSGLGLLICRMLIEAHKGTFSSKKNPMGGAWVHFNLPTLSNKFNTDKTNPFFDEG